MTESLSLLEKAAQSMDATELLLDKGYPDIAASRAYYAGRDHPRARFMKDASEYLANLPGSPGRDAQV